MESKKIDIIIHKLDELNEKIKNVEKDTAAMKHHIEFINLMYEKYKGGLDFVHNMFSRCK